MSGIKYLKVNELFNIEKGSLQSSKNIEGAYHFITASTEWKTHETYTHDCEALIFAMGASGSLGRTHYVNNKFISSDLCFILTPKDSNANKQIDMKFYYFYFNTFREDIVKKTATGTSKIAINLRNFSKLEIPYFDLEYQQVYTGKIEKIEYYQQQLKRVLTHNLNNVTVLKQQILKNAIQGKLVQQDESDEPASLLLRRIKEEKEQLIKEKKIRKEKSLPKITDEEKPFELPKGWEWMRLSDIALKIVDGTHHSPKSFPKGDYLYITAKNIKNEGIDTSNVTYVTKEVHGDIFSRCNVEKGDILLIKDGATTGIVTINQLEREFSLLSSVGLIKTPNAFIDNQYLVYCIRSPFLQDQIKGMMKGSAITRITIQKIKNFVIPIPPLDEQKRIVKKVNRLMVLCDELEGNIWRSKQESEKLMRVVLQEAFEVKEEVLN